MTASQLLASFLLSAAELLRFRVSKAFPGSVVPTVRVMSQLRRALDAE